MSLRMSCQREAKKGYFWDVSLFWAVNEGFFGVTVTAVLLKGIRQGEVVKEIVRSPEP